MNEMLNAVKTFLLHILEVFSLAFMYVYVRLYKKSQIWGNRILLTDGLSLLKKRKTLAEDKKSHSGFSYFVKTVRLL